MDQLVAKLTNLGYEVLGIFFPGLVLILFFVFGWWCLGPVVPFISNDFLPNPQINAFSSFLNILNDDVRVGMAIFLAVAAYFCGHLLHWLSRQGGRIDDENLPTARRVGLSILFKIPKPASDYHQGVGQLFNDAKSYLGLREDAVWREYYPVAKSYLAANLQSSLAPTFQTKYTLHRSLATASAVWFWGAIIGIVVSAVVGCAYGVGSPKWIPLLASPFIASMLIYGFSGSYRYNWLLWGDTLISEIYMLKNSPK